MTLADSLPPNERIQISLKTLLGLEYAATKLRKQPHRIHAKQAGQYLSAHKGRGMAFEESRLYQAGDDVRHIDWRVTARTDKTHSKVFREERETPLLIAVDYRATMQFATRGVFKSVQAAKLAGLLAWSAQQTGDRIGGQIFSEAGIQELKPQAGKPALLRFFNALSNPRWLSAKPGLDQALLRLRHHARPGCQVVVLSDFRDLNRLGEQQLAQLSRHCEVLLIQLYDPLEAQLPSKGRLRFTDSLRDLIIDSNDPLRQQAHQQRFLARQQHLQQLSRQLGISWLSCGTDQAALESLSGLNLA